MRIQIGALMALTASVGHAQGSIAVSGQLDAAFTEARTRVNGASVSKSGLYPSGMASSFLRFEGQEDLGSGLYAGFRLEAGLNNDTGNGIASNANNQATGAGPNNGGLSFNRWAFVAVGHRAWGELRAGRVYTAAFENFTPYDPFFTNGVGSSTPVTLRLGIRNTQTALNVSNAIEYLTPNYGKGFFARATVARGENLSDGTLANGNPRHGGDHEAVRIGYADGPWAVAYSIGLTHNTAGRAGTVSNPGDYINSNLALRYDFPWARFYLQWVNEKLEGATAAGGINTGIATNEAKTRSVLLGTVIPIGAGNIKLSYVDGKLSDNIGSAAESGKLVAAGYDYYLSKRTNVYGVVSRIKNNGVGNYGYAAAYLAPGRGEASTAISVGMKHIF